MSKNLFEQLEESIKAATLEKNGKWSGSGYIGIDWTPVRLSDWREIKRILSEIKMKYPV